jgi:CRISPR-associated protein Cas2
VVALLYLVSYDIEDDADRARIHTILSSYGDRVQYSVFECWLDEKDLAEVKEKVTPHVTANFDSVRFYGLCGTCVGRVEVIGWGDPPKQEETWVV